MYYQVLFVKFIESKMTISDTEWMLLGDFRLEVFNAVAFDKAPLLGVLDIFQVAGEIISANSSLQDMLEFKIFG